MILWEHPITQAKRKTKVRAFKICVIFLCCTVIRLTPDSFCNPKTKIYVNIHF
jgi:hypothetical protein